MILINIKISNSRHINSIMGVVARRKYKLSGKNLKELF